MALELRKTESIERSCAKAAAGKASSEPFFLSTAGTGSSDPSTSPWPTSYDSSSTEPRTSGKERPRDHGGKTGGRGQLSSPAPYDECRLPMVGIPCKTTVIDPPVNSDGTVPSIELLITSGGVVPSAEPSSTPRILSHIVRVACPYIVRVLVCLKLIQLSLRLPYRVRLHSRRFTSRVIRIIA